MTDFAIRSDINFVPFFHWIEIFNWLWLILSRTLGVNANFFFNLIIGFFDRDRIAIQASDGQTPRSPIPSFPEILFVSREQLFTVLTLTITVEVGESR